MSAAHRFWAKVDRSGGPEVCWPWTGERDRDGYGRFEIRGRRFGAHRLALETRLRRHLAPGMCSLHACDNPPCVNPAHLYEGTRATNNRDMIAKGRHRAAAGPFASSAKLSGSEVLEIREASGIMTQLQLARRYGVSKASIHAIQRGKTYRAYVPPRWVPGQVRRAEALS